MTSALDIAQVDDQTRPQDDLFRHVNGPWLRTTEIQPDRSTAGAFVTLHEAAEQRVRSIIESASAAPADDEQRKIADLWTSFMDTEPIESAGASVLRDDLATIDKVTDIARFVTTLGSFERLGVASVIGLYCAPDRGQPDRYLAHIVQSGIGLPDESYYREDSFAEVRDAYVAHLATMLTLAGLDDAEARASRIMELETALASHHWDRVRCRDTQATYNLLTQPELADLTPRLDWTAWANAAGISTDVIAETIVSQPSYLQGLDELLTEERFPAWLDWLRAKVIAAATPYLSEDFVAANFEFYGKTLQGTAEQRPRWKRGVSFVEGAIGEAVGKIYVSTEYRESARDRMDELITNLIAAYRESIESLIWMGADTKRKALEKLEQFTPKVGHPAEFKDYSALQTDPADLLGNARRSFAVAMDRELAKIGSPIDRNEWYMTPQTVNAYYNPTMNEIVFPAAILQPPFFDPDADDAVNYGGIGAIIGHEIGHGFDDQGSQYDGTGELANWWTDADRRAFDNLTGSLVQQYAQLSPDGADGQTVNGELTLGENIGDLGGLGIAYRAFMMTSPGEAPIDGLTPTQRFFVSWARTWQGKVRPTEVVRRLTVDPHSPPEFRCNQVVRNIDAFHDAFGVTADDALWLDPSQRVTIW